jgi:hypothetical protein
LIVSRQREPSLSRRATLGHCAAAAGGWRVQVRLPAAAKHRSRADVRFLRHRAVKPFPLSLALALDPLGPRAAQNATRYARMLDG